MIETLEEGYKKYKNTLENNVKQEVNKEEQEAREKIELLNAINKFSPQLINIMQIWLYELKQKKQNEIPHPYSAYYTQALKDVEEMFFVHFFKKTAIDFADKFKIKEQKKQTLTFKIKRLFGFFN